jgi:hypothetical protein
MHARLACLAASLLVLGGCISAAPKSTEPPIQTSASVDATNGGVEGKVVTDEIQPIAAAEVAIVSLSKTVKTDEAGAFAFSHVAPGDYGLAATRIGYFQGNQKVTIKAGEIVKVQIVLKKVPVADAAYDEVMKFSGQLTTSDNCEGGGGRQDQLKDISWKEYTIPVNATKADGTDIQATHMVVKLKSKNATTTVDVDMYLYDGAGKEVDHGTSAAPDETMDKVKLFAPGAYKLIVWLCLGVQAEFGVTTTITYEQGERAKYVRDNPKSIEG